MSRLVGLSLATLLFAGSASAQSVVTYARVVRHAVVLEQPRGDSPVLTTIPAGVVVELVALRGDWYQTSLKFDANGLGRPFGWIQRQTVELLPAQAQEQLSTAREVAPQQRSVSGLEQPQIGQAPVVGSVPTTPRQPTRPVAATPSPQNPFAQLGDVAVGYVFLYSDGQSMPLGFAASNAWRVHPNVDIAVESQFSHKTFDFGFVSDAANEWSVLAGPRFWFGPQYGQSTRAFGQVLGGMLSVKPVFTDAIYGLGVQPGFGVEVPVSRTVAIRPQYDLMIGRLQGEMGTDHRFKVNVVFRLFGG